MSRILPEKLGNRMFLGFFTFIMLPLVCYQWLQYAQMERTLTVQIMDNSERQLNLIKSGLGELKYKETNAGLVVQNNKSVQQILERNDDSLNAQATIPIQDLFRAVQNQSGADGDSMQFDLEDERGNLYSYHSGIFLHSRGPIDPEWMDMAERSEGRMAVRIDRSLSTYVILEDNQGNKYGKLRISVDLAGWLARLQSNLIVFEHFALYDQDGKRHFASQDIRLEKLQLAEHLNQSGFVSSWMDSGKQSIWQMVSIPELHVVLVGYLPLELYFGNLALMKSKALLSFGIMLVVLIALSYVLSSMLTRPLGLLQRKMSIAAENSFDVKVPLELYHGELKQLGRTFNEMTSDLQDLIRQLKEEERQRAAIRFQMLLAQMNPHFLLNALNTIKLNVLYRQDKQTAGLCAALGKLLETSMNGEHELIYLKQEAELVNAYAHIQSFRYDRRFQIEVLIPEELEYALVPKLSLQPLVENAIIHGLEPVQYHGTIRVSAEAGQGCLQLIVEDNGKGLSVSESDSAGGQSHGRRKGIGLNNLRERLTLLYQQEATLALNRLHPGTQAIIRIPLLLSNPYSSQGGMGHVESSAGRG